MRFILLTAGVLGICSAALAQPAFDQAKFASPDELAPGMTGIGRTVMSGTKIETFNFEVISVLENAFYAGKDVILIRCSGLNLEHTGILQGMSGSPCYIREDGKERMIGAVAYGWSFSKDPICGVQPITEMLDIPARHERDAGSKQADASKQQSARSSQSDRPTFALTDLMARLPHLDLKAESRFRSFDIPEGQRRYRRREQRESESLSRLLIPVQVSSVSSQSLELLRKCLPGFAIHPLAGGSVTARMEQQAANTQLAPGSALVVPLLTGDLTMEAVGTCTVTMGDQVLGFGHDMFGDGEIELPMATGYIHTTLPSLMSSSKLGASLKTVGTLRGDESSGIYGTVGKTPHVVPMEVEITDSRGSRNYNYTMIHEPMMTPVLAVIAAMETIYANSNLPLEHTMRYGLEVEFGQLGSFRVRNFASQTGAGPLMMDLMMPMALMMDAPFKQQAKVSRVRAEIQVEDVARQALINRVTLPRRRFKPGDTVEVEIRWQHYRQDPMYTQSTYEFKLPDDLPDGNYPLQVTSMGGHLRALQQEKPHLMRVDSLEDMLKSLNLIGSFPQNQLFIRLPLPESGLAYKRKEWPELPTFRQKILSDSALSTDIMPYRESHVEAYETDFTFAGGSVEMIEVRKHLDTH
jgi:hypothetical protein